MPHGETACFVRIVFPLKDGLLLPKRKSVTMGRENQESHRKIAKKMQKQVFVFYGVS